VLTTKLGLGLWLGLGIGFMFGVIFGLFSFSPTMALFIL